MISEISQLQYSNQLNNRSSSDIFQRIIRNVFSCVAKSKSGDWILNEPFVTYVSLLRSDEIRRLANLIDSNRLTIPVYEALGKFDSPALCKLKVCLKPAFLRIRTLKTHRNTLLRSVADVLDYADVDYAVFKTLNRLGSVGVDIDVIIDLSSYDRCVKALLDNGFFPLDDLSKRYATCFMVKDNPVIVDLHTELAVLGVRYMSSDSLLRRRRSIIFQPCGCSEPFSLSVLDDAADALVRMVHCVLKEGVITIGDVAEILHVYQGDLDLMADYVNAENLRLAVSIFSYVALHNLGAEQFRRLIMFDEDFTNNLAKNILANSIQDSIPPFKLSVAICMLAFIDCLKRRRELGKYMPLCMYSFRFRSNAAHLGHKILWRLRYIPKHGLEN